MTVSANSLYNESGFSSLSSTPLDCLYSLEDVIGDTDVFLGQFPTETGGVDFVANCGCIAMDDTTQEPGSHNDTQLLPAL